MEKQKLFKRESKNLYRGVNWIARRKYRKREELDERTKGNARWSSLWPLIDVIDIIVEGREQDTQNRISIRLKTVPVSFSFARGQLKLIYLYRLAGKFLQSVSPRRWGRTASYKIELTIVAILLGGGGVSLQWVAKRNEISSKIVEFSGHVPCKWIFSKGLERGHSFCGWLMKRWKIWRRCRLSRSWKSRNPRQGTPVLW